MKYHAIYVPGYGDNRGRFQRIAIQLWRLFGVVPHYVPVGWYQQSGYDVKEAKITDLAAELHGKGKVVGVVGVSAGGSICLNAFTSSPAINSFIGISGKIRSSRSAKPAPGMSDFDYSLSLAQQSLAVLSGEQRRHILTIHPSADQVVPLEDMQVAGTKKLAVPGRSHPTGIAWGITWGMVAGCRFIRRTGGRTRG